jgi:UDP-3-O-[3-hydroxymyristoyl] glucosamine N-acyltransferase
MFNCFTGIVGCVIIKDEVTIWGQVGTTSGITIGEKVVLGQTGVTKSLKAEKLILEHHHRRIKRKIKTIS